MDLHEPTVMAVKTVDVPSIFCRQFESTRQSLNDFWEWMTWMTKLDEKEEADTGSIRQ